MEKEIQPSWSLSLKIWHFHRLPRNTAIEASCKNARKCHHFSICKYSKFYWHPRHLADEPNILCKQIPMPEYQTRKRLDKNEKHIHTLISQLFHVSHSRETHKHGVTRCFTSLTRGRDSTDVRPGRRRDENCKAGGSVARCRRELYYCQPK